MNGYPWQITVAALPVVFLCGAGCTSELPSPQDRGRRAVPSIAPEVVAFDTAGDDPETDAADASDVEVATDTVDTLVTADDTVSDADTSDVPVEVDTSPPPPMLPVSCLDLLTRQQATPTGRATIDPDGDSGNAPVRVHCDMDLDGGGWTLVGRSDNQGTASGGFGWSTRHGDVDDYQQPYSLGALGRGLGFTQVAVGSRPDVELWGNVYLFDLPPDFATACAQQACAVTRIGSQGSCSSLSTGEPERLAVMGFTDATDRFHIAAASDAPAQGLFADRFVFDGEAPSCSDNGALADQIGMIMVR